jgi:hypothetical protein
VRSNLAKTHIKGGSFFQEKETILLPYVGVKGREIVSRQGIGWEFFQEKNLVFNGRLGKTFSLSFLSGNISRLIEAEERHAARVARWNIFKQKIPIWVNFGGSWNGKCWPFGLF